MLKKDLIIGLYKQYIMPTYIQVPLVLTKAKGVRVWDIDGNEYLDFFPGWAVSGLGHCHPRVVKAIRGQVKKIMHVSNNYYNELQPILAKKIVENSFSGKVFFANSGAEANECAIKLARRYGSGTNRYEIITAKGSFHGRTLATITATGQDKVKTGFGPLPVGFKYVAFNNFEELRGAVTDKTIAIMLEPVQGEGGINVACRDYLVNVRKLCYERNLLLIFDEVQTGMGRCGRYFAYQHFDVLPDIMTLAKSLGSGVPIGATVAGEKIQDVLSPSSHASTFGGSPVCCSAALATFEAIEKEGLLENAVRMGEYIKKGLLLLKDKYQFIKEIRGLALMIGVELDIEAEEIYKECFKKRLLINCTQKKILRLMPPLIVKKTDVDKALSVLDDVFSKI